MEAITLTQDKYAIVDNEDYEELQQFKWFAYHDNNNTWYARRNIRRSDGIQTAELMHRRILGIGQSDRARCDHRNHDGLDNRRENLRTCTRQQNRHNRLKYKNNTSGFKGVTWRKQIRKWAAQIKFNNRVIHLGYFNDKIEAACAYDRAALKYFGDFACLNFPPKRGGATG